MKKLATSIALIAGLGVHGFASAESTTGNAHALLLTDISFTEDQIVEFGTIPNGTGNCTMGAGGALSGMCTGTGIPGQFTLAGTALQNIGITVGNGSTDNNVTYNPLLESNGALSDTAALDASGNAVIKVIGSLALANAAGGERSLTYTLTVNYQ